MRRPSTRPWKYSAQQARQWMAAQDIHSIRYYIGGRNTEPSCCWEAAQEPDVENSCDAENRFEVLWKHCSGDGKIDRHKGQLTVEDPVLLWIPGNSIRSLFVQHSVERKLPPSKYLVTWWLDCSDRSFSFQASLVCLKRMLLVICWLYESRNYEVSTTTITTSKNRHRGLGRKMKCRFTNLS